MQLCAGLAGGYTFFALLASFAITYLVLTLVDKWKGKTSANVTTTDKKKKNYNFLASLTSMWIPCIPGSKPHTFLTTAVTSLLLKIFWLSMAVVLNLTKTIRPNTYLGFCQDQEDAEFFVNMRNLTLCQVGGGAKDQQYDSCFNPTNSSSPNLQKIRICTSEGEQANLLALTFCIAVLLALLSITVTWQLHKKLDYHNLYEQTKSFCGCCATEPQLHQSVVYDLCTSDENEKKLSEVVVDQEAVINRPRRGQTALHLATQAGAAKCASVLLEAGAKVVVDSDNRLPAICTVAYQKNELNILNTIIPEMKSKGILEDSTIQQLFLQEDEMGQSLSQLAVEKNKPEFFSVIIPQLERKGILEDSTVQKMVKMKTVHHKNGLTHYIMVGPALVAWAGAEGDEKEEAWLAVMEIFKAGAVLETGSLEGEQREAVVRAEEEWRAQYPALKCECVNAALHWGTKKLLSLQVVLLD